jgi:tRNA(adenine34) deaminase
MVGRGARSLLTNLRRYPGSVALGALSCMREKTGVMSPDEVYMRLALEEAAKAAAGGEVPVGAVLVGDDGAVIASAHNAPIGLCDPTAHAEILVLRAGARVMGNYRLPGCRLYVTLEPCAMCVGAMLHARVAALFFGAPDPKSGAVGSVVDLTNVPSFNHYVEVLGGIEAEACARVLQEFFRRRRIER